jgi:hypothetical protein
LLLITAQAAFDLQPHFSAKLLFSYQVFEPNRVASKNGHLLTHLTRKPYRRLDDTFGTGPRGEGYRRMIEVSAVGRPGTPDEVANVAALLMGRTAVSSRAATFSSMAA